MEVGAAVGFEVGVDDGIAVVGDEVFLHERSVVQIENPPNDEQISHSLQQSE